MFDQPVFKVLSRNDTGAASGHQGGMVIPQDLEDYMPSLNGVTDAINPTIDQMIEADLYLDGIFRGKVSTRYQYQTWGGARSAERRLTGNLGAIRNFADRDDILIIERSLDDPLRYRLSVETQASSIYAQLRGLIAGRRWGPLNAKLPPAGNHAIDHALSQIEALENTLPTLISNSRATTVSLLSRKVRDLAFRKRLVTIYGGVCAISGRSLQKTSGGSGLDAAHVIPVEAGGTDDPRNGLLLSKDVHWAFDNALIYVNARRAVVVPQAVRAIPANDFLRTLNGCNLSDPNPEGLRAAEQALEWHRNAVMEKLAAAGH
jgi:putative restriction endonuclease